MIAVRDPALLRSLRERVGDMSGPDCALFAEVWFACTGKQSPYPKARFAILLDAGAWTDAALLLARSALPEGRVSITAKGASISVAIGAPQPPARNDAVVSQVVDRLEELGAVILGAVLDDLLLQRSAKAASRLPG